MRTKKGKAQKKLLNVFGLHIKGMQINAVLGFCLT